MPTKRKIATAKPATVKPATVAPVKPATVTVAPVAPVTVAPATDTAPASINRGLARDAAGIVRAATNFEQYSDRDTAYLAFFGNVMRQHGNRATLAQIKASGIARDGNGSKRYNPNYSGSAKATDIGAINRLIKAGYLTYADNGETLVATATALTSKAYIGS